MLHDVLTSGLDLVVCGSAVGEKSAMRGEYYAGPGNKFWRTLHDVKLTPYQLEPSDYKRLAEFGIGLTDLVKAQSGNDRGIRFRAPDGGRLRSTILRYQPRYLCFNGKRAAQEFFRVKRADYGLQPEPIGATVVFVAPSTSAAANGSWNLGLWQQLADLIRAG